MKIQESFFSFFFCSTESCTLLEVRALGVFPYYLCATWNTYKFFGKLEHLKFASVVSIIVTI